MYWRAYLMRGEAPGQSREYLNKAASLSPYLVFPFREESIPVFEWAKEALPADWKARYYLGLIYWGLRRNDDALAAFAECGERPDFAQFYISRGFLWRYSDSIKARADYERAHAVDRKDWRNWFHLVKFYNEHGMFDKALRLAEESAKLFPDEELITVQLARTFLNNGRYQGCFSVLEKATILPFEGQRDVHRLFVQCQICLALEDMKEGKFSQAIKHLEGSKEYPERLGTGKPYNPDYRVQDYLMMFCYEEMGDNDKAGDARKRISDYTFRSSKESIDILKGKIDQWYRTKFPGQNARKAFEELSEMIRGRRDRR